MQDDIIIYLAKSAHFLVLKLFIDLNFNIVVVNSAMRSIHRPTRYNKNSSSFVRKSDKTMTQSMINSHSLLKEILIFASVSQGTAEGKTMVMALFCSTDLAQDSFSASCSSF